MKTPILTAEYMKRLRELTEDEFVKATTKCPELTMNLTPVLAEEILQKAEDFLFGRHN
jgi:hypothetical protein